MNWHLRSGSTARKRTAYLSHGCWVWGLEWVLGKEAWGLGGDIQIGGEKGCQFLVGVHLPRIANLHLSLKKTRYAKNKKSRQYGFMLSADSLRLSWGCDEWHEKKYGFFLLWNWKDWLLGVPQFTKTPIHTEDVTLTFPEGEYRGTATLFDCSWKRPRWVAKLMLRVEIEMIEPIPIPTSPFFAKDGSGQTAVHSFSCAVLSIAEGLARLHQNIMDTRLHRGGASWRPKEEKDRGQVLKEDTLMV